ncbi:hypothetical protein, partial [Methyloceanibacter marginalis]|uniref:hypothetical protein n=1 Tax=Methyloceanibacter marginalis TaxID=1774971 RepID=UPI001876925C
MASCAVWGMGAGEGCGAGCATGSFSAVRATLFSSGSASGFAAVPAASSASTRAGFSSGGGTDTRLSNRSGLITLVDTTAIISTARLAPPASAGVQPERVGFIAFMILLQIADGPVPSLELGRASAAIPWGADALFSSNRAMAAVSAACRACASG